MVSQTLITLLEDLDLISNDAVFFFNDKDGETYNHFSLDIQKKLEIIKPNAFFVFNNQPYILFFDLTEKNSEFEKQIHKQVWSFDYSPLIFIIKYNEIQVFNAFDYNKKTELLEAINLNNQERNKIFSFWNLQSGESWKWLQAEHYGRNIQKKRVNQRLFDNIKLVRSLLAIEGRKHSLTEEQANTLILRLIFIRYLIDRGVKVDQEYVNGDTILERRKSFNTLIQRPQDLNSFFEQLNDKFNGVLFKDVTVRLSKEQALTLSYIFSGKTDPQQQDLFDGSDFYFEVFDFSIIPVEVISGIYESLINEETKNSQSAIYTPPFLAEYMLAETVDKFLHKNPVSECKIFDPACGSGIFLVQSYRRMIDKEISMLNGEKIKKTRLKEIAQDNLYGIDINKQALMVTCFSIYIALLDYQDPKSILVNFHFPKLIGENLFNANFFDELHSFNELIIGKQVDFILGNPPWKSTKEPIHIKWLQENNHVVGRYEIAQSFLKRSKDFMQEKTVAALIVTSTIFYNVSETTRDFKRTFLTQFCLDRFFDLSPVRRLIFEEKNSPAAIVYYRLSDGESHKNNIVHHLSIKSNIFLEYYKTLIIEKQDQKRIQQELFLNNDWMFKVALYGGILDFNFIKKLNETDFTINTLISNRQVLFKGDGIYKGTPKREFDFLLGKPVLETNNVSNFYTHISDSIYHLKKEDIFLESGRRESLFNGESILLKHRTKDEESIVVSYVDSSIVFRHGVYGITTNSDTNTLKLIYSIFISELFTYFQFLTSSAWGVATRPEIKMEEYLSFPYQQFDDKEKATLIQFVNYFLLEIKNWYTDFNLGYPPFPKKIFKEINSIIDSVYQVSVIERDLICYSLEVSRYQFREGEREQKRLTRKVDSDRLILEYYADIFLSELQSIYNEEYLQVEVYPLNSFIAMNFTFQQEKPNKTNRIVFVLDNTSEKEVLKRIAANLTISKLTNNSDPSKNLYIQKDIKGFEDNSFFIIKPNEYKCWHRAMAWYDVAEIKEAIEQAELTI